MRLLAECWVGAKQRILSISTTEVLDHINGGHTRMRIFEKIGAKMKTFQVHVLGHRNSCLQLYYDV